MLFAGDPIWSYEESMVRRVVYRPFVLDHARRCPVDTLEIHPIGLDPIGHLGVMGSKEMRILVRELTENHEQLLATLSSNQSSSPAFITSR
jgi:hypothetical protein